MEPGVIRTRGGRGKAASLAPVDAAKVKNIVEVCNVSAEEATRVLHACRMDETLAMDRFLSGEEKASEWSEVSKKKKSVASRQPLPSRHSRGGFRHDRDQPRDSDRRTRDRSRQVDGHPGRRSNRPSDNRDPAANGPPKTNGADNKSRPPVQKSDSDNTDVRSYGAPHYQPGDKTPSNRNHYLPNEPKSGGREGESLIWEGSKLPGGPVAERGAWGLDPSKGEPAGEVNSPDVNESLAVNGLKGKNTKESPASKMVPKMTINYAAAAKAGTGHGKVPSIGRGSVATAIMPPVPTEEKPANEGIKTPQNNTNYIPAPAVNNTRRDELAINQRESTLPPSRIETEKDELHTEVFADKRKTVDNGALQKPSIANAWDVRTSPNKTEDPAMSSDVHQVQRMNTPVDPNPDDSLVIQFGTLEFGSLNTGSVNWSSTDDPQPTKKHDPNMIPPPTVIASGVIGGPPAPPKEPVAKLEPPSVVNSAPTTQSPAPKPSPPVSALNAPPIPKDPSPSVSSAASVPNNFQPLMTTASFPPPSYPPYMIAPPVPYAPGISTYDNGPDMSRSRNPNPAHSLPMYDHSVLSFPSTSNGAKFNPVASVGENPVVSNVPNASLPSGKEVIQPSGFESDKPAVPVNGPPLPNGLDTVAPQYMMAAGYPYMMPGYPSLQYAPPPGLAPPAPNHFPFTPVGQVSSQGAFGAYHAQNTSVNKFNSGNNAGRVVGFEDAAQNVPLNVRGGNSLIDGVYSSGYLVGSDGVLSKGVADNPGLPNNRGGVPTNPVGATFGAMGVTASTSLSSATSVPMSSGLQAYSDNIMNQAHNVPPTAPNMGHTAVWNGRQANATRTDANVGSVNGNMPNSVANAGMYAPAGAPGGYWAGTSYY